MFLHQKNIFFRFYLITIFAVFSCSKSNDSETSLPTGNNVNFIKTIGGSKNESAQAITKTDDGGYAILGHTQSMDGDITNKLNESFDYWLIKFDKNNNTVWQKTYGGTDNDRGKDINQTNDGGFALIGFSQSNDGDITENNGAGDFWVIKTGAAGEIIWEKSYGFLGADTGTSIIQTYDNGFLLTGVLDVSASQGQGNSKSTRKMHAGGDYWAIKLNTFGEKEWSKFYGGTFTDTPYDAIQTADNGYIIVGSSDSDDVDIKGNNGSYDFWVIKISEGGTLLWEKSFGGSEIDEAYAITQSNDGNYIIVGDTRSDDQDVSFNNGAADLWVIKISPTGDLLWEKTYGGTSFDVGRSVSKTNDDGFIISGSSRSADGNITKNNGQNDAWIVKIDTNGNLIWQKTIGGSNTDFAHDTIELDNSRIITVGESSSSDFDIKRNQGFNDVLIFEIELKETP
ncbi:hypothetical protein [Flavisericum labens]|uniref:hypothetical protein n=1 Tax=Flavisericum labens TaxID=3377112 RepID=UPI00387B9323